MFARTGRCVSQYGPAPNILIAGSLPAVNLPRQAGQNQVRTLLEPAEIPGAGSTWSPQKLID